MDKESLISYISKLNDRNLQRQQASGFTLWAILGVFAYLVLDLSEKIPFIYNSPVLKFYSVIILAVIIDIFIFIFLLISSLVIISKIPRARRLFSTIDSKSSMLLIVPSCFVVVVFSIINFKAASLVSTIGLSPWIFWFFSLFFALNGIYPFVQKINQFRKSLKAKAYYPEISPLSLKMRILSSIIYAILSIGGLFFLYLTYRDVFLTLEAIQISLLLKTSAEILGIFILILALFKVIDSSNKFEWLENLEREFYLDNLSESKIMERLEREYIGYDIFTWISKREEILNIKSTEFLNLLKEEKPKIEELEKIDPKFQHEIAGRRNEICNKIKKKLDEYLSLAKETAFQLKEITKQGLPDDEEVTEIKKVYKRWEKQFDDIEIKQKEFCKYCQQACARKPFEK